MPTKKIRKEFKEADPKEVRTAIFENFFFGLSGAIIVPFIALRIDIAVLCGYLIHYLQINLWYDNTLKSGYFYPKFGS